MSDVFWIQKIGWVRLVLSPLGFLELFFKKFCLPIQSTMRRRRRRRKLRNCAATSLLALLLLVPRLEIGVVVLMGGDGKTYRHTERSNLLICIIPISSSPAARLWLSLGECVHPLPSAQVDQLSAPRFSLLCPRERPKRGIQTHTHDSIIHSRCTVSVAIHVAILTPEEQLLVRRVYYSVHAHTAFRY